MGPGCCKGEREREIGEIPDPLGGGGARNNRAKNGETV